MLLILVAASAVALGWSRERQLAGGWITVKESMPIVSLTLIVDDQGVVRGSGQLRSDDAAWGFAVEGYQAGRAVGLFLNSTDDAYVFQGTLENGRLVGRLVSRSYQRNDGLILTLVRK
jgi:hypothetical protein